MTCNVNCWYLNFSVYLGPNETTNVYVNAADWTKFNSISAGPNPDSAGGASVQIITVWATQGQIHATFKNNGSVGVSFIPRGITTDA